MQNCIVFRFKLDNVDTKANRFEAMDAKRFCIALVVICLVVSPPTRALDIDERGPAQALRVMNQLRAYLKMGPETSLEDVVKYAVKKLKEMKKRKNKKNKL